MRRGWRQGQSLSDEAVVMIREMPQFSFIFEHVLATQSRLARPISITAPLVFLEVLGALDLFNLSMSKCFTSLSRRWRHFVGQLKETSNVGPRPGPSKKAPLQTRLSKPPSKSPARGEPPCHLLRPRSRKLGSTLRCKLLTLRIQDYSFIFVAHFRCATGPKRHCNQSAVTSGNCRDPSS